jgi:hypothetical protein
MKISLLAAQRAAHITVWYRTSVRLGCLVTKYSSSTLTLLLGTNSVHFISVRALSGELSPLFKPPTIRYPIPSSINHQNDRKAAPVAGDKIEITMAVLKLESHP